MDKLHTKQKTLKDTLQPEGRRQETSATQLYHLSVRGEIKVISLKTWEDGQRRASGQNLCLQLIAKNLPLASGRKTLWVTKQPYQQQKAPQQLTAPYLLQFSLPCSCATNPSRSHSILTTCSTGPLRKDASARHFGSFLLDTLCKTVSKGYTLILERQSYLPRTTPWSLTVFKC